MAAHRKSYKQTIRSRLADQLKDKAMFHKNPHQATCQWGTVKYWWPTINTQVIVKPHRKVAYENA